MARSIHAGGLWFVAKPPLKAEVQPKPQRQKKPAIKNDPKLIAAARELRDRYLEEANRNPNLLTPQGKYDVARALLPGPEPLPYGRGSLPEIIEVKALPQAA